MFNQVKISSIFLFISSLIFWGCDDKSQPDEQEAWPIGQNVYIAGFEEIQDNSEARLWKNGKMENLASSVGGTVRSSEVTHITGARSVYVSGNDVYVAGYEIIYSDGKDALQARLWKNGEIQPLENGVYDQTLSVFVTDNDVYVLGSESLDTWPSSYGRWSYKYWKNGKAVIFSEGKPGEVSAGALFIEKGVSSIFVSDGVVYVAGGYGNQAKLWIDGVEENLTDGAFANSVFVSGDDVYVVGNGSSGAKLWKNGVQENLVNGDDAYSVYVSGNDVYVAGRTGFEKAILWKNGIAQPIADDKDAEIFTSVYVSNEDVYTSGYVRLCEPVYKDSSLKWCDLKATLWKNGKILNLKTTEKNNSQALSVFVK